MIDSGATSTFVWVVIEGKVDEERTRVANVGGYSVGRYLKEAMAWKDFGDAAKKVTFAKVPFYLKIFIPNYPL